VQKNLAAAETLDQLAGCVFAFTAEFKISGGIEMEIVHGYTFLLYNEYFIGNIIHDNCAQGNTSDI
jgi:hypothetical protein